MNFLTLFFFSFSFFFLPGNVFLFEVTNSFSSVQKFVPFYFLIRSSKRKETALYRKFYVWLVFG